MRRITNERIGEYLKTALNILNDKGGEFPLKDLQKEMLQRIDFTEYEKSLNNSGQYRWLTAFRFYSINTVKAGWIQKPRGKWILTNEGKKYIESSPIEIFNLAADAYDKWNTEKKGEDDTNADYVEEEMDEPEVLMEVKPNDITFQNLLSGITNSRIQIPPFQRSFVWKPNDIRYLLDSIYRGFPIGSFIFWKTIRKLPYSRSIGNITLDQREINPGTEISYVLDGQQRITSLFAAIKGSTIDEEEFQFLFNLKSKKFIVKKSDQIIDDETTQPQYANFIPVSALFLESRREYNQLVRKYSEEYQGILDTLYDRFASYRFSVIEVIDRENGTDEDQSEGVRQVVRMFSRINETGRKLTIVAKMVARCWGEGFDLREALDEFYKINPGTEQIREETVLQIASVILNYRKCRSRVILENTNIQKLENDWDTIINSLLLALEFIKNKLHIKNLNYLPYDALLVPLAYLFNKKIDLNSTETGAIEKWFWRASLSNRYDATVEAKIEEDCVEIDEILAGNNPKFDYLIDWDSLKNRLIAQPYNLRNAFVKTILALYSYNEPKNITDGRDVSLDSVFTGYYKHNFHHIFPQAYLRSNQPDKKELFDSIVNIMFIPRVTNNNILDTPPSEYFAKLENENKNLTEILKHHLIFNLNESRLLENDLLAFLDYRAERIVQAFRIMTGISTPAEEHFDTNPTKPVDIIENRLRQFIHDNLRNVTENSYWDERIPQDIKEAVERKIQDDLRRHPYKLEEYMRDEARISFLDIMDYSKIILSNWSAFKQKFGSKAEVEQHFRALKNYRNSIKHVRVINPVDKRMGEAAILWIENIIL